ncbi:hypothetical protein E5S70_26885 [Ensifer adhaerens]|uniref:hypothetical protein n=1 Tax=Ensifer canadensis TaxID=555315 RepID=UPI00148FFB9E|nr:hypothetical protein [Ensifer canadensis]NOV19656.1 hypothetical protein [Ensifer canadensis]
MLQPHSDHRSKFVAEIKQDIQALARRLHYRENSSDVYVVGNSLDFDYVAQSIIDLVGTNLAGAATFWPKPAGISALTGNQMFAVTQEFVGNCDRKKPDLLFCQACIGSSRETIAMVSRVLDCLPVHDILIAAIHIADDVRSELETYFADDILASVKVISLNQFSATIAAAYQYQAAYYSKFEEALGDTMSGLPKRFLFQILGKSKPTTSAHRTLKSGPSPV